MANNYLQFSEELLDLSEEEEHWLRHQLEFVLIFGDREYCKDDLPEELNALDVEWAGCRAYRGMDGYEFDLDENAGFDFCFSDDDRNRYLWLYVEESGCVDRVAHLVQKFLREFHPDQCWSLTYANTCSKPRVGEFGGGGVFVTADDIKWHNAHAFIEQERAAFDEPEAKHADV